MPLPLRLDSIAPSDGAHGVDHRESDAGFVADLVLKTARRKLEGLASMPCPVSVT